MKNKKHVPDIRFRGLTEEWKFSNLDNLVELFSGLTYSPTSIRNEGTLVLRSSNVKDGIIVNADNVYVASEFVNSDYVVFGDIIVVVRNGSRSLIGKHAMVDRTMNNTVIGAFMTGLRYKQPKFLNALLYTKQFDSEIAKNLGATINQITNGALKSMYFTIPQGIDEQQAIGNYFQSIDRLINTRQTKLDKLKNIKRACLEKMFPCNGSTTPELRFKGFAEEWKHIYLKDTGNWDKGYGLPKADLDKEGLYPCIHYGELFAYSEIIKSVTSYTNIKSDKITSNNDILFPDSDVTPDGLGRCSAIEIPNVILGGGINVLKLYKDFKAPYISLNVNNNRKQIIERVTGTTVRHIHSKDLNNIELFVSENLIEQHKIGDYFEKLDDLIAKTEQQINKLKNIKKACLDKMFVNMEGAI